MNPKENLKLPKYNIYYNGIIYTDIPSEITANELEELMRLRNSFVMDSNRLGVSDQTSNISISADTTLKRRKRGNVEKSTQSIQCNLNVESPRNSAQKQLEATRAANLIPESQKGMQQEQSADKPMYNRESATDPDDIDLMLATTQQARADDELMNDAQKWPFRSEDSLQRERQKAAMPDENVDKPLQNIDAEAERADIEFVMAAAKEARTSAEIAKAAAAEAKEAATTVDAAVADAAAAPETQEARASAENLKAGAAEARLAAPAAQANTAQETRFSGVLPKTTSATAISFDASAAGRHNSNNSDTKSSGTLDIEAIEKAKIRAELHAKEAAEAVLIAKAEAAERLSVPAHESTDDAQRMKMTAAVAAQEARAAAEEAKVAAAEAKAAAAATLAMLAERDAQLKRKSAESNR